MPELPLLRQSESVHESASIARDLANAIEGEVRFDAHNRMLYSTDASLYQVEPIGVVIPASIDDSVEAIRFCARRGIAMLPRGGGTSLAGQCTNRAVVIDFSAHCRGILDVDIVGNSCRVEPGITVDDLNDSLSKTPLFFAPDPATSRQANIGGCIGNNAAGARSILYGRTSESIIAIDACLADGVRVRFGRGESMRDARVRDITRRVLEVVLPISGLIRERFPKTVRRNAGYGLDMIVQQLDAASTERGIVIGRGFSLDSTDGASLIDTMNLAPLLCGSEGTLAVTIGAELRLHAKPRAKGLAVLGFESLDAAIEAVVPILSTTPSAVELLDDIVLDLARANTEYARYVELMPTPGNGQLRAILYVEYFASNEEQLGSMFRALTSLVPDAAVVTHTNTNAMLNMWKLRKAGEPLLHGVPGRRKPITFVEDNAVPVKNLARFVREFREIVARHGTIAAYYAHASVGVLHVRPLIDIHDEQDRRRMRSIASEVAELAKSLGGVMSGEHGDGRVRSPFLERYFGPEIMAAFRAVKHIFDPSNLLNPGNIVEPRPVESITERLRVEPRPGRPSIIPDVNTFFRYDAEHGFDSAVEMCNGAGVCRKKQGGTMCPSYMATLDERHSTRGRGNALRLAITGQFNTAVNTTLSRERGTSIWDDPGTLETLNLCLSCKACKTECPSNVDIAKLKSEYAAQRYKVRGAPISARIMGEIRFLNRLGSIAPTISNFVAATSPVRGVLSSVLNFDPRRSVPRFSRSLARRWHSIPARIRVGEESVGGGRGEGATSFVQKPVVALFADCFTMYNEPEIGLAVKQVFDAFGYGIRLADAGCCGRAKISVGLLAEAIETIDATIDRLRPLIDDPAVGAILVAEPSCLSAIKDDWLALKLRAPLSVRKKLAEKCFLPEDYLHRRWDSHPARPEFVGTSSPVILHGHCHQKALWGIETSAAPLKRFCGGLRTLDSGCCGMAGSFGYTKDRYDLSMKIGEMVLFPMIRAAEDSVVAAPGTSCRHQIHDGTGRDAKHPIVIIAEAIGRSQP